MKNLHLRYLSAFLICVCVLLIAYFFDFLTEEKHPIWSIGTPIVTYWAGPSPITESDVLQMKDGGWNLVWVTLRGIERGENIAEYYVKQLDILEKHNMRAIVSLGKLINRNPEVPLLIDNKNKKKELETLVNAIKDHNALYAYHLIDEPNAKIFKNLARLKNFILNIDPAHLVYVNLYPNYTKTNQLGVESYIEYLQSFVKIYQPQLLSYDHYTLSTTGDKGEYFANLAEIRKVAIKSGIPFMVILQASSWSVGKRIPTGEELSWQMYTILAYGAQGISWYVYGYPGHDGGMIYPNIPETKSSATLGGKPTPLYYYTKVVNNNFKKIASELQETIPMRVYHLGMIPKGAAEQPSNPVFKILPDIPHKELNYPVEGLLVGVYGDGKKETHALIVNLDFRTFSGRKHKRRNEFLHPVQRYVVANQCIDKFDHINSKWILGKSTKIALDIPPSEGMLIKLSKCNN